MTDLPIRLTLHIEAGRESGFVVLEAGDIVAAFSSAADLATYIETRARQVEQARPYGAAAGGGPQDTAGGGQIDAPGAADLPAVVLRPRQESWAKRRLFG